MSDFSMCFTAYNLGHYLKSARVLFKYCTSSVEPETKKGHGNNKHSYRSGAEGRFRIKFFRNVCFFITVVVTLVIETKYDFPHVPHTFTLGLVAGPS